MGEEEEEEEEVDDDDDGGIKTPAGLALPPSLGPDEDDISAGLMPLNPLTPEEEDEPEALVLPLVEGRSLSVYNTRKLAVGPAPAPLTAPPAPPAPPLPRALR